MPLRVVTAAGVWPEQPRHQGSRATSAPAIWGPAWVVGPAAPGTVLDPRRLPVLAADAAPGDLAEISLVFENHQRVLSLLRPMVSGFSGSSGGMWSPEAALLPPLLLLRPGDRVETLLRLQIPAELDPDRYRGELVLVGVGGGPVEITLTVTP
ncbi:MAG TPA: hypothetical protein VHM29_11530 [Acidimicrobiia bacterium]|nr:hypothetical protein [Acidimicrobiia bacterium]